MQALQYLLKINAQPKGVDFLRNNNKLKLTNEYGLEILDVKHKEEKINKLLQFASDKDNINKQQRIILIAKDFEESIYSMGEWLSEKGVGFTCISYDIYKFNAQDFISFSVKFDSKPYNSYQLIEKNRSTNKPTVPYYYHNSGSENRNNWNETLIERNIITCGFDGEEGDKGWKILKEKYHKGDKIFLYQNGKGVIAVGEVSGEYTFKSDVTDDAIDHKHRLPVKWEANNLTNCFTYKEIKEYKTNNENMFVPSLQTSSRVSDEKSLAEKFYQIVLKKLRG